MEISEEWPHLSDLSVTVLIGATVHWIEVDPRAPKAFDN